MILLHAWLRSLLIPNVSIGKRERILSCIGAAFGLFATEWICRHALEVDHYWLIAPMGASAVLLFAAPASPLAQPRAIIMGNLVSALIGVAVASHWGHSGLAASLAVSLSIAAMFWLGCLHPPSGAVALCAVFGDDVIERLGYGFAIWPVTINSVLLLLSAMLFNACTGRRYPQQSFDAPRPHGTNDLLPLARSGPTVADLEAVLLNRGELLDISKEDLVDVLGKAEQRVQARRLAGIRCRDIMSHDVITIAPGASLLQAKQALQNHKIKLLPVIEKDGQLIGVISLHDIFTAAESTEGPLGKGWQERTVGECMNTSPARTTSDQPLSTLAALFSDHGMHHLPVVNQQNQVVGMLSQSDFVGALLAALV